jgi:UDP-N-acetylmuramate--alanine ligase
MAKLKNYKHIHFVGIKGVGMAGLAVIAKQMGKEVTGSDIAEEFITQDALNKKGIQIWDMFSKKHISKILTNNALNKNELLVVTTGAHQGFSNIEAKYARKLKISVLSHGEALGLFMRGKIGVSVAGTHGKTTTASMIAHILKNARLDPSYAVGTGSINSLGLPAHLGHGKYFIAEADEYVTDPVSDSKPRFLWQTPKILVLTNIEYDHPDVFSNTKVLQEAFLEFAAKVPGDGVVIACIDSPLLSEILNKIKARIVTYGYSPRANYRIINYGLNNQKAIFSVSHKGDTFSKVNMGLTGKQNAANGLASILAGIEVGISWQDLNNSLSDFTGTGRRFEKVGEFGKALLYDDYAHHPTEIKATLKMAKDLFPERVITAVFQPHTYSRTKALFNEFSTCFEKADRVILTDIFPSAREKPDPSVSTKKLADAVKLYHSNIVYCPKFDDVVKYLKQNRRERQVIITMGAGDVYKIHNKLKTQSSNVKTKS